MVREGLITDLHAHQVHLLGERHRLRQSSLVAHYSKGEGKYLRLLTKWLRNEEAYFAALLPLLPGAGSLPGAAPAGSFSALPMNTSQKLQKLEQALSQATAFKKSPGISAAFTAWQDATCRTLAQLYGAAAFESTRFRELRFAPRPGTRVVPQTPDHQERRRKAFQRDLHIAVEALTSYIADLSTDMTNTEQLIDAGAPPTSPKRVFISHATTDAAVVDELLDILGVLGLGSEHIFCSSVAGYGIPLGENFYERLKSELTADVLVLFVLSPNFFQSPVCLCEMGAAWVLTKDHVPVLVPPFDFADMRGVIPATQGLKLTDKLKITELGRKVARHCGLPDPTHHTDWERRRDKSLHRIEQLLGQQAAQ